MEKPRATRSLSLPLEEKRRWEGKKGFGRADACISWGNPRGSAHHSHTHSWAHPTQVIPPILIATPTLIAPPTHMGPAHNQPHPLSAPPTHMARPTHWTLACVEAGLSSQEHHLYQPHGPF